MKKSIILALAAAFSLVSGAAGAATLTNHDKDIAKVQVEIAGKQEIVKLKPHETFDSKDKDAIFTIASEKPVEAKGAASFVVKDGKIMAEAKEESPAAGTATVPEKVENKPIETPATDGKK